jgi:hypothetical protein
MNVVSTIVIILLMLAVVVSLVRGIVAFLKTTEAELMDTSAGPSANQLKQNKMMMNRVLFQGLAIIVLALVMMAART